jgi:hypothetical protein
MGRAERRRQTVVEAQHLPLIFGLKIRRLRTRVRRRARLVNSRFKISRFLNKDGSELRVCGFLGKFEKRRHLTHKIMPAQHNVPQCCPAENITQKPGFGSVRMYKIEHMELRAAWFHRRNTVSEVSGCATRAAIPSLGRFAYRCRVHFDRVWHPAC